jgi:ABC-type glutathione transport system ATPase component
MTNIVTNSDSEQSDVTLAVKSGPEGTQEWSITDEVHKLKERDIANGGKSRKVGVTWQNLNVKGTDTGATFNENVLSQFNPFGKSTRNAPLKTIIDNSFGCVKPGEMLLVLGRPGAGCTSLLSMLSNHRLGYAEVTGDVHFASMTSEEAKSFRGQIIMNTEEEVFFPTLSVGDTLDFATRMKVPYHLPPGIRSAEEYAQINKEFLLRTLGITHTHDTKVGDTYVRGVSGGERKRVSILECLATRGSVFCWYVFLSSTSCHFQS